MSLAMKSYSLETKSEYPVVIEGRSLSQQDGNQHRSPVTLRNSTSRTSGRDVRDPRRPTKRSSLQPQALAKELFLHVWSRLELGNKPVHGFAQPQQVIRCFVVSHRQLAEMADDAVRLLNEVCRHHATGLRSSHAASPRQKDIEEKIVRECNNVKLPSIKLENALEKAAVASDAAVAAKMLTDLLARIAVDFVASFVGALEKLADKEVVGFIQWRRESVCKFHYFRRLVVQKVYGSKTIIHTEDLWRIVDGMEFQRTDTTTTTATSGEDFHLNIRFEHGLMDAMELPLDASNLVIPKDVQRIVHAVPSWLAPVTRIAVGECFFEQIVPRMERRVKWLDIRRSHHTLERPISYSDPALVIGTFVLAGWGEKESRVELARRAVAKKAKRSHAIAKDSVWLSAVLFAVGALMLTWSFLSAKPMIWPSVIICLLSIGLLNVAVAHHRPRQRGSKIERYVLVNMSAALFLLTTISGILAVVSGHLSPIATTVVLSLFFVPLAFSTVHCLWRGENPVARGKGAQ